MDAIEVGKRWDGMIPLHSLTSAPQRQPEPSFCGIVVHEGEGSMIGRPYGPINVASRALPDGVASQAIVEADEGELIGQASLLDGEG
jgi:hypothetical protein